MKIIKYILPLLIITAIIISCSDDQCNSETESLLKTEIIVKGSELSGLHYIDSLSLYSPEWSDSIHYSEDGNDGKLSFMLSPYSDTTEIVFTSKLAPLNDTIFIFSQREYIFLSPECGFVVNYKIDTVLNTYNYIDSLIIIKDVITTNAQGHIQIYF